jgi:hypothetical protein
VVGITSGGDKDKGAEFALEKNNTCNSASLDVGGKSVYVDSMVGWGAQLATRLRSPLYYRFNMRSVN